MRYDVVMIGAGPGGYVGAIRMAQLGFKVALIEEGTVGGVCLNWGCIPTKALYSATKLVAKAKAAGTMGIEFAAPRIDISQLSAWKQGVVAKLVDGIKVLLKSNGVTLIKARARLDGSGRVALSTGESIESERVVLATGSSPAEIHGFSFSHPGIWSSTEALALTDVPEKLLVIGAGVIGLELATIYNRLGSAVTVIEMMPDILPGIDLDRRNLAVVKRALTSQRIAVHVDTGASSVETADDGVVVHTQGEKSFEASRALVAVGRRPNSEELGLETVGIEPDRRDFIPVNENLQTDAPGVYAIGDLIGGPMLAHKASAEAVKLAAFFAGERVPLDYDMIPQAIFTDPEVACVGLSEKRAKEAGYEVVAGRFPYAALGKAQGMGETEGFFQVVAEAKSGRLLGAQIVGVEASDLISEAAIAVQNGLSLSVIADAIHPHPTLPEGLKEAAENALGRAIHTANR